MKIPYVMKKGGTLYYVRKVPKELRKYEPRALIRKTLKTDNPTIAAALVDKINAETEKYFATLANGGGETAREYYENAVRRAKYYGVVYRPAVKLADGPIDELLNRLNLADQHSDNKQAVEAILGGVDKPALKVSDLTEIYFNLSKGSLRGKSEDQVRRWRNPRLKAVRNFKEVIGDRVLSDIDRDDALSFRDWWLERLNDEGLTANSANKDFGHIQKMIKTVCEHHRIEFTPVFTGLNFPEDQKIIKLPFETKFIIEKLIAPDVLTSLLQPGRDLIRIVAETGARPSEVIGLDPETELHLSHNVPYIHIRQNQYRTLKTRNSEREIPLVGCALLAAQDGAFERFAPYRHKSRYLTDTVSKYFRENNYLPSNQHTLYSLRHSFSDRLVGVECPDHTKNELMGHVSSTPSYGQGPALSKRLEWLERIQIS